MTTREGRHCPKCRRVTQHSNPTGDFTCDECVARVMAERGFGPAAVQVQQAPAPKPGSPTHVWQNLPSWAKYLAGSVALVAALGFVRIIHGGDIVVPDVMVKESWSLDETFVDIDDYRGHSVIEIIARGDAACLRDLIREGLVAPPGSDE